jgi:hypothetical protein
LPHGFVHGSRWFQAAPRRLLAVMWAGHDVDGRFALYEHEPDPRHDAKIMWVVPARATGRASDTLRIEWRKPGSRTYTQREGPREERSFTRLDHPRIYPSALAPPAPGCWKLRLRTGRIKATMRVIVEPQPPRER